VNKPSLFVKQGPCVWSQVGSRAEQDYRDDIFVQSLTRLVRDAYPSAHKALYFMREPCDRLVRASGFDDNGRVQAAVCDLWNLAYQEAEEAPWPTERSGGKKSAGE
jgi:hypothetical protein